MHRSKKDPYSITSSARARRDVDTVRPSVIAVDDQFIFRRLLIRQIAGFFTAKNTADVGRGAQVKVDTIRSDIDQATNFHRRRLRINRKKTMPGDDHYDLLCAALESKITTSLAAETMSTTTFDGALTTMPPPMHSRRNF